MNPSRPVQQSLRFTPYAWAKLLFLRDAGPTEVGAFGVCARQDLLLVRDLHLIKQKTTAITVVFDDEAVADYLDAQVDQGLSPEQCLRCWIHTHPGESPAPSMTDEETFARCFGATDWAVMFILARGGQSYARLRFNAGPGGQIELPVTVDWSVDFAACATAVWQDEYDRLVHPQACSFGQFSSFLPDAELTHPTSYPFLPEEWDERSFYPILERDDVYYGY
jgi:hypothetical protein